MSKKNISFVLIILFTYLAIISFKVFNNDKRQYPINSDYLAITKTTKYTPKEIYGFIEEKSWPNTNEFYDIIINWYDYYPKTTPFITSWGKRLSYEEYEKIRREYYKISSKKLFKLLLSSSKDNFKLF